MLYTISLEEVAMPLTDAQIRSFKAGEKRIRKTDGHGLYLEIMPSGCKSFAWRIA